MKGFIFGFQRFVWCPKWTPASNNSGTNSVVSAIREIPRRGNFQSGSVKMLQHPRVRNLKLRCLFRLLPSALRSAITQLKSGRRHRALKLNSTPLTGGARVLLRASRQNPAEIRKTVHVTQNLRVEIFLAGTECSDVPLRAPACCACKIKRRGKRGGAGDHPVFRIKCLVFLEFENDRCNTVHHRRSRTLKPI